MPALASERASTGARLPATRKADTSAPVHYLDLLRIACRVARKAGLNECDAEDVASMAVASYLETPEHVEQPLGWIIVVARRAAWKLTRTERRRRQRFELVVQAENAQAATQFETAEALLDLKLALSTLDQSERRVVLSHYWAGDEFAEIAESTGVSKTTVKRRIKSGRESLKRAVTGRTVRRGLGLTEPTEAKPC